jgi:hypothetical protein
MGRHDLPLIPARIRNEDVYCPRLQWSEHEPRHNADTAEGEYVQRRFDEARARTPLADDIDLDAVAHELTLRGRGPMALGGLSHFGLGLLVPERT